MVAGADAFAVPEREAPQGVARGADPDTVRARRAEEVAEPLSGVPGPPGPVPGRRVEGPYPGPAHRLRPARSISGGEADSDRLRVSCGPRR